MKIKFKSVLGLPLLVLFFVASVSAQNQMALNYHSTHTGRNLGVSFVKSTMKHSFILGIKFHLNRTPVDNQNHVFYKRFYADNFKEHIGFHFGYHYQIGKNSKKLKTLVFCDFQYLNATIRRHGFTRALLPGGGGRGFIWNQKKQSSATALENNLGLGFRINLSDKIVLIEKAGIGINVFTNLDGKAFTLVKSRSEYGVFFGASLLYEL